MLLSGKEKCAFGAETEKESGSGLSGIVSPPLPFEDGRGGRQVSCAAVFPAEGGREKVKNEESPGNRAVLR